MERGKGLKDLAIFFALSFIHVFRATAAGDTMSPDQTMSGNQTLISAGGAFELGFFSPKSSSNKYLGIWYKSIPGQTIVWVANRDTPLKPSSTGTLTLNAGGNLLLLVDNATGDIIWSTTTSISSNPTLQLLDSGNLILRGGNPESTLWQSFDYPSDTMLPEMKLGFDMRRNLEWHLTSWKSSSDPSQGAYTYKLDSQGYPELYLWSGASRKYGTGAWNGHGFSGVPFMRNNRVFSFNFIANQNESYAEFHINQKSVLCRLVLDQSGVLQRWVWLDVSQGWYVYWSIPQDQCDAYAECGPFGVCNAGGSLICDCMRGFVPKSPEKWALRDSSDGCVRRVNLSCATDGFVKVAGLKLPGTLNAIMEPNMTFDGCKDKCARNCSCTAFFSSLEEEGGCINWFGGLVDIREFQEQGQDLHVRLAASDLVDPHQQGKRRHLWIIFVAATSCLLLIMILILYFIWRRKHKYRAKKKLLEAPTILMEYCDITRNLENNERNSEFSLFQFSRIVDATSNFADENKLGEGGFGSVYKGQLPDGQEIAVKRLAACSRQGFEEFQNEIILIAKLQHRNLVKLLGCCTQGEEQLLIYEYMPNKSLDVFLFDLDKRAQLDWDRRVEIIEGIAQGLLYLHKHSRLRIIHRDLKASNVLLDGDMTPKISDFGMARIFGSDDRAHSSTKRIVGTYGYMSPEYAIKGQFSVKSDVFSFGVLMLEIISGQKNASFQQYGHSLSLLGYAWESWKNDNCLEFVDLSLRDRCPTNEISKCIQVALLCVQDSTSDRPTMSNVITMLHSESASLPSPKEPAFFSVGVASEENPTSSKSASSSNNQTITVVHGR